MKKSLVLSLVIPTIDTPTVLTVSCANKYLSYQNVENYVPIRKEYINVNQYGNWITKDTNIKIANDNI